MLFIISELASRKGTNGVNTNGVSAILMLFDRGTFWALPLTCFCLPKSARAYLFPQSIKIHYFCSGPTSVDPICPQPTLAPNTPSASTPLYSVNPAGPNGQIHKMI